MAHCYNLHFKFIYEILQLAKYGNRSVNTIISKSENIWHTKISMQFEYPLNTFSNTNNIKRKF